MEDLFFWKNWDKEDKWVYGTTLVILTLTLLIYLIQFWVGERALIHWQTQSDLDDVPILLDTFRRGVFNLRVEASNYVITERFVASDMAVNYLGSGLFLGLLTVGAILGLSTVTFLSRLWYVAGMAAFIGLLINFRLELLTLFGTHDNTALIVLMTLYGGLSYYFQAFRTQASLPARLLSFTLLTLLIAAIIALYSSVPQPILHLTSYGIIVPLLIGLAFTFLVAAEIPNAFLYLITRSNNEGSRNSFLHFTVANAVYLFNLLYIYLKNAGFIELEMLYISPFLVYVASVVLGVWGYRKRSTLFEAIIPFNPYGACWYAALAIISTATFGYLFATANDPLIEVFEDVIVFSHLAMGITFFGYLVVNFGPLLRQNKKVYKVVYKPTRMPFFAARGIALLIILALFFRASMFPYYQAVGGYYNGLGDLSTATKAYFLAEQYYKLGSEYGTFNHKSPYALASLARIQNDPAAAGYYFKQAMRKHPTPYDYANLANVLAEGEFFQALFTLKEGVQKFPESGELFNNLALLYNRTSLADSAFLYFDLSKQYSRQPEVAESNLLAFWAKHPETGGVDSLLKATKAIDYLPFRNNQTVLQNLSGNGKEWQPALVADSTLNRNTFAYLFNQALGPVDHRSADHWDAAHRNADRPDTSLPLRIMALIQRPENDPYAEDLAFARASYEYQYGNRTTAIETLKNLCQQATDRADLFNRTLGAWLLQGEAYRLSAEYSAKAKDPQARFNRAVALSEGGMEDDARIAWQQIVALADSVRGDKQSLSKEYKEMKPLAEEMLSIYDPAVKLENLDEDGKVIYLLYRKDALTDENKTKYAPLLPKVKQLAARPEVKDKEISVKALASEKQGNLDQAEALYKQALAREPLNEELLSNASRFFREKRRNNEAAYNVLVNAIQLNPYSVPVYKAYIRQCLEMSLTTYAAQGLQALQDITDPADYQAFLPEYREKLALIEKQAADFN